MIDIVPHLTTMKHCALRLTRNRSDAEDLVQDTVVLLLANMHKYQDQGTPMSWVATVMRNHWYGIMRRRQTKMRIDANLTFDEELPVNQEAVVLCREIVGRVYELESRQRDTLVRIIMGDHMHQIAAAHGCPEGTVKSRVHRARVGLMAVGIGV